MLSKFKKLKKNLDEIKLFEDSISTRDTDDDVSEFQNYVKKCLEIVNDLIKKEESKPVEVLGNLRIGFWTSFNNDLRDSHDISNTQSFYNGYAYGLFKCNKIVKPEYDVVLQRIIDKITMKKTFEKSS